MISAHYKPLFYNRIREQYLLEDVLGHFASHEVDKKCVLEILIAESWLLLLEVFALTHCKRTVLETQRRK